MLSRRNGARQHVTGQQHQTHRTTSVLTATFPRGDLKKQVILSGRRYMAKISFIRQSNEHHRSQSAAASKHRRGILAFEWVILISLLVIGAVGAYTALRDGAIDELGDICGAVLSVDQSFTTSAPANMPWVGSWGSWQDDNAAQQMQRGRNL